MTMTMNTRPGEFQHDTPDSEPIFTPAEREAAEAYIFQRLAALGAPQEVIAATHATLDALEVSDCAHRRLQAADPDLFRAWDDLNLLDPLTRRAAIESWVSAAKHEPAAAYHLGFAQAVILMRIELAAITGREAELDD